MPQQQSVEPTAMSTSRLARPHGLFFEEFVIGDAVDAGEVTESAAQAGG